jgi:sulfate adenylyltransferase subunit 2
VHTDLWKTEGLKQALDLHGFDAAFGGARRDEEKSRAKERIFSLPQRQHRWDPKQPASRTLARCTTCASARARAMRVFPLSNWTELDVWQYIRENRSPSCRCTSPPSGPVVERDGTLIMVDDDRMPLRPASPRLQ